jgi:hypothetical protein
MEMAMKFLRKDPPRVFQVGQPENRIFLKDCGSIQLEPDELVTFRTEAGGEFDVARKDWGFYAAPSLNGRLREFGFRAVLVKSAVGRFFLLLVESGKEPSFERYLEAERMTIVSWLSGTEELDHLERSLGRE